MGEPAERGRVVSTVYELVHDLVPRAFAVAAGEDGRAHASWWASRDRFVFPHRVYLDHWELTLSGEPLLAIDARQDGVWLSLEAHGARAFARLSGLLEPGRADRLVRFTRAAGRFDGEAVTGLVLVDPDAPPGRAPRPVPERTVHTADLGAPVLEGLVEAGLRRVTAQVRGPFPRGPYPALHLARAELDPGDGVAVRRTTQRMVELWRPVWGLPVPRPDGRTADLDERLAAAYRQSLRHLVGRRPSLERAALRLEVRELVRLYRDAGRVRPRILGVLAARLHVE